MGELQIGARILGEVGVGRRATLREWIDELVPGKRKSNIKRNTGVQFFE